MFKVLDTITGDVFTYDDLEDFRTEAKNSFDGFDESVHDAIDELCEACTKGAYTGDLEAYLGIEIDW